MASVGPAHSSGNLILLLGGAAVEPVRFAEAPSGAEEEAEGTLR
jgi:hypothetical protein